MKTSDLIGPALDWAVAQCPGDSLSVPFHDGIVLPDALMRGNS